MVLPRTLECRRASLSPRVDDRPINSADALVAADGQSAGRHGGANLSGSPRAVAARVQVTLGKADVMKVAAQCSKLRIYGGTHGTACGVGGWPKALVVVVDDRTAHGDEDHSGPLVTRLLTEAGFVVDGVVAVSADEVEIRNALNSGDRRGGPWWCRSAGPG